MPSEEEENVLVKDEKEVIDDDEANDTLMEELLGEGLFAVPSPKESDVEAVAVSDVCIKDFLPRLLERSEETKVMICLCNRDGSGLSDALMREPVEIRLGEKFVLSATWVIPGVITATFPPFTGRIRQAISVVIGGVSCSSRFLHAKSQDKRAFIVYKSSRNRLVAPKLPSPRVAMRERLEAKRKRGETKIDSLITGDKVQLDDMEEDELTEMSEVLLQRAVDLMIELAKQEKGMSNELNSLDESGYALLHYTVIYNHERLTRVLLQHGANTNLCTATGDSPLHFAAENGNTDICRLLLQHGADGNLTDAFGLTAFHIAQQNGNDEAAALLESECHSASNSLLDRLAFAPAKSSHVDWNEEVPSAQKREDIDTKLLRGALASMSLKDRCALSLVNKEPHEEGLGRSRSSSDVQSIVSENEENLQAAIAAMHETERAELEEEARKIQTNFRKWMLRKNVETSCKAQTKTKKYLAGSTDLETTATKVQAIGKGFLARREYSKAREDVIQLQAATRGVLVRREFQKLRNQVNSILVIQRSVRARQMRRRQVSVSKQKPSS